MQPRSGTARRLKGVINPAALTLDAANTWNVTGDSALTSLSDAGGISGTTITNIIGNGHTVIKAWLQTASLKDVTCPLVNGGTLALV